MSKILKIFIQPLCPACPSAKALGDRLKNLTDVKFYDVSTADGLAEARLYDIMSTPTLVLVEDNKEIQRWIGAPKEEEVKKRL